MLKTLPKKCKNIQEVSALSRGHSEECFLFFLNPIAVSRTAIHRVILHVLFSHDYVGCPMSIRRYLAITLGT